MIRFVCSEMSFYQGWCCAKRECCVVAHLSGCGFNGTHGRTCWTEPPILCRSFGNRSWDWRCFTWLILYKIYTGVTLADLNPLVYPAQHRQFELVECPVAGLLRYELCQVSKEVIRLDCMKPLKDSKGKRFQALATLCNTRLGLWEVGLMGGHEMTYREYYEYYEYLRIWILYWNSSLAWHSGIAA